MCNGGSNEFRAVLARDVKWWIHSSWAWHSGPQLFQSTVSLSEMLTAQNSSNECIQRAQLCFRNKVYAYSSQPRRRVKPISTEWPRKINTAFLYIISIIWRSNEHDISLVIVHHDVCCVTAVVTDVVSRINGLAATLSKPQWKKEKKKKSILSES